MTSMDFQKLMDVADAITECKKLERFVREKNWPRVIVQFKAINALSEGEYGLLLEAHLPDYLLAVCKMIQIDQDQVPPELLLELFNTSDILCMNFTDPEICSAHDSINLLPFFNAGLILAAILQEAQSKDEKLLKASREASFVLSDTLNFIRSSKLSIDPLAKLLTDPAKQTMLAYARIVQDCEDVPTQLSVIDCVFRAANILRSKVCKSVDAKTARLFLDDCFKGMFGFLDTSEARKFFTVKSNEEYFSRTRKLVQKVNRSSVRVTSMSLSSVAVRTKSSAKLVKLNSDDAKDLYLDVNKSSISIVFPVDQEAVTVSIPLDAILKSEKCKFLFKVYVKPESVEDSLERWMELSSENEKAAKDMKCFEFGFKKAALVDQAMNEIGSRKSRSPRAKREVKEVIPILKPSTAVKPTFKSAGQAAAPFGAGQLATICTKTTSNDRRSLGKSSLDSLDEDELNETELDCKSSASSGTFSKRFAPKAKNAKDTVKGVSGKGKQAGGKNKSAAGKDTKQKGPVKSGSRIQTKAPLNKQTTATSRQEPLKKKSSSENSSKGGSQAPVKQKVLEDNHLTTAAARDSRTGKIVRKPENVVPKVSDVNGWKNKTNGTEITGESLGSQLKSRSKLKRPKPKAGNTPALRRWRERNTTALKQSATKKPQSERRTKEQRANARSDDATSVTSKKTVSSVATKQSRRSVSSKGKSKESMHCPWKSSHKKVERKSLLETGGFSDSDTSMDIERKSDDSLLDVELPTTKDRKVQQGLISPTVIGQVTEEAKSCAEELDFSVKNTIKELEKIAKSRFPDVIAAFFDKKDRTKWHPSGRPKWKKRELVDVMLTSSRKKSKAPSKTAPQKQYTSSKGTLQHQNAMDKSLEAPRSVVSRANSESKLNQSKATLPQDLETLHSQEVGEDPFHLEESPIDKPTVKQKEVIKSGFAKQASNLAQSRLQEEGVTKAQGAKSTELKGGARKTESTAPARVTTPIAEPAKTTKKEAQLRLIEKLFSSCNKDEKSHGLNHDNIEWLRQMLESYDETKAAPAVKNESQMQCRTAEIVWSLSKGGREQGTKKSIPQTLHSEVLNPPANNLQEQFEAEVSQASSLEYSSVANHTDDERDADVTQVKVVNADVLELINYGKDTVEKAQKRKRKEQKLLARKIRRLQQSHSVQQAKRVSKVRAQFVRGQANFIEKITSDETVVLALKEHRQALQQTWEAMRCIHAKRKASREQYEKLLEHFEAECSTARARVKELEGVVQNELLANRRGCTETVDKCKAVAKRYKSKYSRMRKQAEENRQRAEVILMSLSKLST